MSLQLRYEQRLDIAWFDDRKYGLYFADVGSGKTVVALTAIKIKIEKMLVRSAIAFAPLRVCEETWQNEGKRWRHLNSMEIVSAAGLAPAKRIEVLENPMYDIVMLNYEVLPWLMKTFPEGIEGKDLCWFDESDKMSSPKSLRFKGVGSQRGVKKGLEYVPGFKRWRHVFERIYGMTGTPTRNAMLNMYAQVYCVDGGERFGQSFYKWRDLHFNEFKSRDGKWSRWELKTGHFDIIMDAVKDITRRGKSPDSLPEVFYPPPRRVKLPPHVKKQYKAMKDEFILAMKDGNKVKTNTPSDAYNKLRQIAAGFIYRGRGKERVGYDLHDAKYKELESLIGELQGAQLIIVYHYEHQIERLRKHFSGRSFADAGESGAIQQWNEGNLQFMALHPQSEGVGLNLHLSGANQMVMLAEPESAGMWKQVVGRLARTGQEKTVYVHRIHARGTIDSLRAWKTRSKLQLLERVLDYVEQQQEEAA